MALSLQDGTDTLLQDGTVLMLQTDPLVVAQPLDVKTGYSLEATFFARATGSGTITYQWYEVTAGLLAGETDSKLTITASLANSGNQYYYIATDT
jgi:hypothetical protein